MINQAEKAWTRADWLEELKIPHLNPVFLGYLPRNTAKRSDWLQNDKVAEICSASTCISTRLEGTITTKLNQWGLYDSEDFQGISDLDIFAFNLLPVRFDRLRQIPMELSARKQDLLDYTFLGFDIVTLSESSQIACSPLSCNGGAEFFEANQFCLIDRFEDAWRVCATIASESALNRWEPGPYFLVEVFRKFKP